jgi:hypothetical protein
MSEQTPSTTIDCNWVTLGNGRLTLWHRLGGRSVSKLKAFGCDCVVTLLSSREGAEAIGNSVANAGIEWVWLPLENGQAPRGAASDALVLALPAIADRLEVGRSILIHCSAGIHRTGMVAYALLRWYGWDEERALAAIGEMRAHTRAGIRRKQIDWGNDAVRPGFRP